MTVTNEDATRMVEEWREWQRAWVQGGARQWPGMDGVVDPCDTVEDLEHEVDTLRAENERLRRLLVVAYSQWQGDAFRDDLPDDRHLKVWFTVAELREIAEVVGRG